MTEEDGIYISEIFTSFEGEGILVGRLQQFIRLSGCSVGCTTCDTEYALNKKDGTFMTFEEICEELNPEITSISITGGDPIDQRDQLIKFLKYLIENHNYFINIELTGLTFEDELARLADFLSLDLKTPSAGLELPENQIQIYSKYFSIRSNLQIKAVVSNEADLDYILSIFEVIHEKDPYANLVITPCWKDDEPDPEFVQHIKDTLTINGINYVRLILQQHKCIFDAKKRGV